MTFPTNIIPIPHNIERCPGCGGMFVHGVHADTGIRDCEFTDDVPVVWHGDMASMRTGAPDGAA